MGDYSLNSDSSVMSIPGDSAGVDVEDKDSPVLIQTEVETGKRTDPTKKLDHQIHSDSSRTPSDAQE